MGVLLLYLLMSLITAAAYYVDKSAAKNQRSRIPEKTLHLLALIGGWPGALAAQQLFRHKTKKATFQLVYWLTVLANCTLLYWLILPINRS